MIIVHTCAVNGNMFAFDKYTNEPLSEEAVVLDNLMTRT